MMKAIKKIIRRKATGMAALQLVLLLVIVGGLTLPVLLSLMMTGAKAGQLEERKTREFYAADAGVTAALWRIKTNYKLDWLNSLSGRWDETVYGHNPAYETYTLSSTDPQFKINDNISVVYTIAPRWALEGLETPNIAQTRNPADNVKVYGSYNGTGTNGRGSYKILIYYDGHAPEGAVGINRIGCWLPAGLEYVDGSSYLENTYTPARPVSDPQVSDFRGGHTIIWNFSPAVDFNLFYPAGTTKEITFEYTPNEAKQGGFCWVKTNTSLNYLSWSALNIFEVRSTATSLSGETTTATSYSIRNVGDTFGSAIEGDYYAYGNTLMRDTNEVLAGSGEHQTDRDRLYEKTQFTVTAIPANAQVEYIFLYWTGWKCKPWNGLTTGLLATLPADKFVNKVKVSCNTTPSGPLFSNDIIASLTQAQVNYVSSNPNGWSYSCFADITDQVKTYFKNNGVDFRGNGTFTVGHWDVKLQSTEPTTPVGPWYRLYKYNYTAAYPYTAENTPVYGWTRYPLGSPTDGNQTNSSTYTRGHPYHDTVPSNEGTGGEYYLPYAAWSIIIVYTSPSTLGRQLYRFDTLYYGEQSHTLSKTISGFVVPDLTDETNAAKMTCFVGEGDEAYTGDSISVNGTTLPSITVGGVTYPSNNVWNSKSSIEGLPITGIDIDTWNLPKTIVQPGATTATVNVPTGTDQWSLVYMILAFRSKITAGGSFIYDIQ